MKVEVKVIRPKERLPERDCKWCKGTGLFHPTNINCPCTCNFKDAEVTEEEEELVLSAVRIFVTKWISKSKES